MWSELRAFFRERGPERPAGPSRIDRWLVIALVPVAIAEALLHADISMRALHGGFGTVAVATIWIRRSKPLVATMISFGLATGVTLVQMAFRLPSVSLYAGMCVLLLPYSLFRWGSGREVGVGLAFICAAYGSSVIAGEMHDRAELIGAAVVLLFPGALGLSIRFRAEAHRREIEHAKLYERAELARDLHDTVAHHVSAIAIQAQAGRAVLAMRPEATAKALQAIESEASRTLSELRSMVRTLRDDSGASLVPQPRVTDIARLAGGMGERPVIEVEVEDGLERLRPAVQSALYRIAQESITNAVRHARGATRVRVRVAAEGKAVRLTVDDDGASPSAPASTGMGLVGMAERAALLGGKLDAGPNDGVGWTVDVVLPAEGERT